MATYVTAVLKAVSQTRKSMGYDIPKGGSPLKLDENNYMAWSNFVYSILVA